MANLFLSSRFSERVRRLVLGIEPIDALRNGRVPHPISVTFDEIPLGLPRPQIVRHDSGAFALLYEDIEDLSVTDEVAIRLFDSAAAIWSEFGDRRCYVPRRLRVPLLSVAAAEGQAPSQRGRRPALFPGAAYSTSECATGLRGRVTQAGDPVRWVRVQAMHPDTGQTVGVAHGDDRGEFLLMIDPAAGGLAELTNPMTLDIRVFVPITPVVSDDIKALDDLWDLPIEDLPAPGVTDDVSTGLPPWSEWTLNSTTSIDFKLGILMRGMAPLTI